MGDKLYRSSLRETVSTTATDLWNDSSSVEGLRPEEFEHYGASVRTLRQFIGGYIDLLGVIRNFMLPDQDKQ
ncbi:MAG TPA: hypothetical protein ENI06_08930 [Spirochaetales bacterium]|nr:hypothetical protein [Spirochaetales bacterium]